jgi:hypothetical protein
LRGTRPWVRVLTSGRRCQSRRCCPRGSSASRCSVLVDALAVGPHERDHALGTRSPPVLLRHLRCTQGELMVSLEFVPRPEYGRVLPLLEPVAGGVLASAGVSTLRLSSPLPLRADAGAARAWFTLREGESVAFALECGAREGARPSRWTQRRILRRIEDTARAWESWSSHHQDYQGPWSELVQHSGRVLHEPAPISWTHSFHWIVRKIDSMSISASRNMPLEVVGRLL